MASAGSKILSLVLVVLVALVAYLVKNKPDVITVLLPKYLDGQFILALYPKDKTNSGVTRLPLMSEIIPSKWINKDNLRDVIHQEGFPVVVPGIVDVNQEEMLDAVVEANTGKDLRLISFEGWDTPHISPSCAKFIVEDETVPFDKYAREHLLGAAAANHSYHYAGFESITDAKTVEKITGIDWTKLGSYKQNNLFVSNFPREILTAPMHCAPIDSVSVQLMGEKTWYFISPDDLDRVPNVPMPTAFNLPMTDDEILSKIKTVHVVKQKAGDLIYFGPNWCHVVYTAPGPNLMFNMRYMNVEKIFKLPFWQAFKIFWRNKTRKMGGLPQENVKNFPILYQTLNQHFTNCGLSDAVQKMYKMMRG